MDLPPHPSLAPYVERVWYATDPAAEARRERRLPTGTAQLIVNLADDRLSWFDGDVRHTASGTGLTPVTARAVDIDRSEQRAVLGVSFRPGGPTAFVGEAIMDAPVIDMAELWPGSVDLRDRLIEAADPRQQLSVLAGFLRDATRDARPLHPYIAPAARSLAEGRPVAVVAEMLGTTTGTLHRRFRAAVGLAPKSYARIARLQRLLAALPVHGDHSGASVRDWASLAAAHGCTTRPTSCTTSRS